MQVASGAAEAAVLGDGEERAQSGDVHTNY